MGLCLSPCPTAGLGPALLFFFLKMKGAYFRDILAVFFEVLLFEAAWL